jgi:hypothetical protein
VTASARQPSWGKVLDTVLTSRLKGVHTALVGTFRSYSEAQQTAEVMLAVQLEAASGEFEELAPLADVPVLWPGDWAAGDPCLVIFCEESFATFWATGSVEQPEVLRRHGLHGVVIPIVARAGQAVGFVALANLVDERFAELANALGTWTPVPNDGGAALQVVLSTLTSSGWPASVAATKVKAR